MTRLLSGLGLIVVLYGLFSLAGMVWGTGGYMSEARYGDMTLLYALVPGYFLAISSLVDRRRDLAAETLERLMRIEARGETVVPSKPWLWSLMLGILGAAFGLFDYPWWQVSDGARWTTIVLGVGNGVVWLAVGWFLGRAIATAGYLNRLGALAEIDLFDLMPLKPVAGVASINVFVTMGALALMPIQSLSTPFRIEFYINGFVVGIPAAIALFVMPQWGLRKAIRQAKSRALERLHGHIAAVDSDEPQALETLLAHRDRIVDTREWPVDHRVFSRAMLYLVVPPLAWVGAAIVERGVDQLF